MENLYFARVTKDRQKKTYTVVYRHVFQQRWDFVGGGGGNEDVDWALKASCLEVVKKISKSRYICRLGWKKITIPHEKFYNMRQIVAYEKI
jgi:hypothetical protein